MLFERLALVHKGSASSDPTPHTDARLGEWASALDPQSRPETLQRFLEWEGIPLEMARQAVASGFAWPEGAPLPPWTETLRQVIAWRAAAPQPDLRPDRVYPFEEALAPFVGCFRQRLASQASAGFNLLAAPAIQALENGLLARLADLAAPTLYQQFDAFRSERRGAVGGSLAGAMPRALYLEFIGALQGAGLTTLCLEYPLLARLLAVQTDQWSQTQVEFLQRLAEDLPEIERTFGPAGSATLLQPDLSDLHHPGRTVSTLRFESGLRLVYKSRHLGIAAAYHGLLDWLNHQDANLDLKPLRVLPRTGYGWVEYAGRQPCGDRDEVLRYFRRMGRLLAVVYLLGGSDCHAENIIACGEHPALVDEETLLRPLARMEMPEAIRRSAVYRVHQWLGASVLATRMLPGPGRGKEAYKPHDSSALGAYSDQRTLPNAPGWNDLNSDDMAPVSRPANPPPANSLPFLQKDGKETEAPLNAEAAGAVAHGFEEMARFWLSRRADLLAPGGPLEALRGQPVRFIFRDTRVYAMLQAKLSQPRYMRSGVEYGLYLERLARVHLTPTHKPAGWPVLAAERAALQQRAIPFFGAHTDDTTLFLEGGGQVQNYFAGPSLERVRARLQDFDEVELPRQTELVRQVLCLPQFLGRSAGLSDADSRPLSPEAVALWSQAIFTEKAVALGRGLEQHAMWGEDGSVCWVFPRLRAEVGRFEFAPLGPGLYDGLAGVLIFMAALEKTRVWPAARRLRPAILQAIQIDFQADVFDDVAGEIGIGGCVGIGSLLYGLTRAGQMLNEPALVEQASELAARLKPQHIAADRRLDILGGAAGAALGLLAVYRAIQSPAALERAIWCGQHLLDQRAPTPAGPRAWRTGLQNQFLSGFAHGVAGIAYALVQLYAVTRQTKFLEAAQEAMAYEASLFVEAKHNWRGLRAVGETAAGDHSPSHPSACFGAAWCTGAAGIGLGRLGSLPTLDTPAIRQDIEAALIATQDALARQDDSTDQLCCGVMGQVEFLLAAGLRLERPGLVEAARRYAAQVAARADLQGGFVYASTLEPGQYNPTFYRGAAGIGYELLRLAYPAQAPSVLMFE
ncbi:MAG: type 2 lantipeptide synthetase LanM [Chloroflexi bacterium]|nr:type 2 lantipeptide synthetase LanM [Chloroflexota bacterium]